MIWTTTPWTLPANLAIVAHPTFTYVAVPNPRDPGEYLIVARDARRGVRRRRSAARDLDGGDRDHAGADGVARGRALPAPVHRASRERDAGLPAVVRRLRRPPTPAPASSTPRPATAPTTTRPAWRTACRRTRRSTTRRATSPASALEGGARAIDLAGKSTDEANPIIVAHLAATGYLLNPTTDKIQPQLPALLALQGADRLPRDAAVVHRDGPRRAPRTQRARRDRQDDVGPAVGPRSDLRDDREPPGLGAVAPAAVGHADPGVLLQRRAAPSTRTPTRWITSPRSSTSEGADAWWTRPVAELVPPGTTCARLRRRRRQARAREGHRRRLVRVRRVVARDGEPRDVGGPQGHRPLPRGLATSTAAGSTPRCSPSIGVQGKRAVPAR